MVRGCGLEPRGTTTWGSGNSGRQTGMACMCGSMETDMKGSSSSASSMVRAQKNSHQESYTRAIFTEENRMGMGSFSGLTVVTIRVIS